MLKKIADTAIVLGVRDYKEFDTLVTLFTKNHGKLLTIARGSRRLKSRKGGHIQSFGIVDVSIDQGEFGSYLVEVRPIATQPNIKGDLKKMAVAFYFIEVVGKVAAEGESNEELFDLLSKYLKLLVLSENLKTLRTQFAKEVLVLSGFRQESQKDVDPDKILEEIFEKKLGTLRVGKRILEVKQEKD